MRTYALSLCLCLFTGSGASAQPTDFSNETCFLGSPCKTCPDVEPPGSNKSILVFGDDVSCLVVKTGAIVAVQSVKTCPPGMIDPNLPGIYSDADACAHAAYNSCFSASCVQVSAGDVTASACVSSTDERLLMETSVQIGSDNCYFPKIGVARAGAYIVLDDSIPTTTACFTFNTPSLHSEMTFFVRDLGCACGWVTGTIYGDLASPGVTSVGSIGGQKQWQLCCNSVSTADPITVSAIDGTLSSWDMNADGRFNTLDLTMMTIASTACTSQDIFDCLPRTADMDGDGDVDTVDIDVLKDVLACGLNTGFFGDANHDGSITCADKAATTIFPLLPGPSGYIEISDPGYEFVFDYDLDGRIDHNDQTAFNTLFASCP